MLKSLVNRNERNQNHAVQRNSIHGFIGAHAVPSQLNSIQGYVGVHAIPSEFQRSPSEVFESEPGENITQHNRNSPNQSSPVIMATTNMTAQNILNTGKRIVGYFNNADTYERAFDVSMLPLSRLTHVHYGYAQVNADGSVTPSDPRVDLQKPYGPDPKFHGWMKQLNQVLKPVNPHIKTLISIGMWTPNTGFGSILKDSKFAENLARNVVKFMMQYGFDGVDILWSYPISAAASQYTAADGGKLLEFCRILRSEMSAQQQRTFLGPKPPSFLISVCLPVDPLAVEVIPIGNLSKFVDYFNITGFNLRGPTWSTTTGNTCPLYSDTRDDLLAKKTGCIYTALVRYLNNGCPPQKINLSSSCIGFGFSGLMGDAVTRPPNGRGIYNKFTLIPKGTWDIGLNATGLFDFNDIAKRWLLQPSSNIMVRWDEISKASFLTGRLPAVVNNISQSTDIFVTYEDANSAAEKVKLVNRWNLGGMMVWELAADLSVDSNLSVLNGIVATVLSGASSVPIGVPLSVPQKQNTPANAPSSSSWWPF